MIKRYLLFLLFILFNFLSCTDKNPSEVENTFPAGINGETSFQYTYIGKAPIHTQSSMLTGYKSKLYRFGSKWPVQVIDLNTKEWTQIPLPDSSFWRWDGLAVTVGDIIYIVAVSIESNSYDIIKLNPDSLKFEHTNINLPKLFHYPAYCVDKENIVFLSAGYDSVYEYNTINNSLKKIADNPFYRLNDTFMSLSSGKYENYLYVIGKTPNLESNLFCRLDLDQNVWEEIDIPKTIDEKSVIGSVFSDNFYLLADTVLVYEYSFNESKWYQADEEVPIFPVSLQENPMLKTEWSFYSEGENLYGTETVNDNIWEISKY